MPRRRLLPLVLALAALALGLVACGSDDGDGGATEATATAAPAQAESTPEATESGCEPVEAPTPKGPQDLAKPKLKLDASKTWLAKVATNCGDFTITLDVKRAPKTSSAFAALAREKYFDGLT